jgi:hypothetical protein
MIDFPEMTSGEAERVKVSWENETAGFILKTYELLGVGVGRCR